VSKSLSAMKIGKAAKHRQKDGRRQSIGDGHPADEAKERVKIAFEHRHRQLCDTSRRAAP
jgi:hypothetical protein